MRDCERGRGLRVRGSSAGRKFVSMEANAGLVAGSHNRNELVVIRQEGDGVRESSFSSCILCMQLTSECKSKFRMSEAHL